MLIDELRVLNFGIVVFTGAEFVILERVLPYNKGQKFFREGFFNDFILYNFVQSFLLGIVISYFIQYLDSFTHLSELRFMASWPVILQVIFFVITHDLYIYWFHRLQHKNRYLWRIHEAHHSAKQVDWISGARSHFLEILINQTIEFAPIVLLGASPEVAIYKGTISAVWGMYIHTNIDVHSGWLQYFINGPEMHRWHHSDDGKESHNKNFSTKLAVWDWLFSTSYFPKKRKAKLYGLGTTVFPTNYFLQQVAVFRKVNKEQ